MPASRALPATSRIVLWKTMFSRTSSRSSLLGIERVEAVAARAQLVELLVGDARAGAPRGVALEQRAKLVQVLEVVGVVDPDHRAAVRDRVDEPLRLEHQQRLADRRPADPQLARRAPLP